MKKRVWIMNHYAGGMYFDRGGRHYNFSKYLKEEGYEPVVFCADSKHGKPEAFCGVPGLWQEHIAEEIGVPFVFVRARTYMGNGKQRVLNMIDFYRNVKKAAKEYARAYERPDVIYASSVHPLTLLAGIQLAKRYGVKCVCEVRDLWPETIVEYSSRFTRRHPLVKLLYQGEKWLYKKADRLIFTMEGGGDYIRERGWEKAVPLSKVYHINNGVDMDAFDQNRARSQVDDPDLDNLDLFKVVYAGAVRRINNLGLILDAARAVSDSRIKFLIWGSGDELDALRERVQAEKIQNVSFKGCIEKESVPSVISRADLNLVHWEMSPILRFGVSYNKLFEYLAAGKPIFSTVRSKYSIVEHYRCGADTVGFAPEDFAAGIQRLSTLPPEELARMGENARKAAEEYDFRNLTKKLIEVLES